MSQAAKKPRVTEPLTIPAFADILGIHRQRIYILIQRGLIKAARVPGGMLIMPDEANRVLGSVMFAKSRKGQRMFLMQPELERI